MPYHINPCIPFCSNFSGYFDLAELDLSQFYPRGPPIFSYIYVTFLGFKFLNFNIMRDFQKKKNILGVYLAWFITKLDFIRWSFLYISGFFLKVNVQNGKKFGGGCQNFKHFWGYT